MESNFTTYYKSPIGTAIITGNELGITEIIVSNNIFEPLAEIPDCLKDCVNQLDEYFAGIRKEFTVKLNPKGTDFQKKVWLALQKIPYGKTITYLDQSVALGDKKAIRAVATANGKNPIWIIIPCHRVIGSNGSLTGYAGGLWRKKWLLEHENALKQQSLF